MDMGLFLGVEPDNSGSLVSGECNGLYLMGTGEGKLKHQIFIKALVNFVS